MFYLESFIVAHLMYNLSFGNCPPQTHLPPPSAIHSICGTLVLQCKHMIESAASAVLEAVNTTHAEAIKTFFFCSVVSFQAPIR